MSEEKKEGCCHTEKKSCGCKKFFVGLLTGLVVAVLAHCLLCGSHCAKPKMCPYIPPAQAPAK